LMFWRNMLPASSTWKLEAVRSSETLIVTYKTT
jgi:hypothetical protein